MLAPGSCMWCEDHADGLDSESATCQARPPALLLLTTRLALLGFLVDDCHVRGQQTAEPSSRSPGGSRAGICNILCRQEAVKTGGWLPNCTTRIAAARPHMPYYYPHSTRRRSGILFLLYAHLVCWWCCSCRRCPVTAPLPSQSRC